MQYNKYKTILEQVSHPQEATVNTINEPTKSTTTLDYYNKNAKKFITGTISVDFGTIQNQFLDKLHPGAEILDYGCGSGRDTKYFLEQGCKVTAIDGSQELCKLASEYTGIPVKHMLFRELNEKEAYDGIWACSSILHVPANELRDIIKKMANALRAHGIIYTSFKYGTFEGERNGRYFTDMTEQVKLRVDVDARFLIGPEGAHLNISGISGLAAKTSYAMFLLKGIQDKCLKAEDLEDDEDVAFVLFNVKGRDLLAIDEPNEFDNAKEREETLELYKYLEMSPAPFKNVHYYYPYSTKNCWNTYLDKETVEHNISTNKAHMYKYEYKMDKDNLDLMFASLDDPTQTMDAILSYIISGRGNFGYLESWTEFLNEVHKCGEAGSSKNGQGSQEITVQSWRKFERIVKKSIYRNNMFDDIHDSNNETRVREALGKIKKNEVHVIDIAKLNDDMQCFVFGDAVRAIYDLQLGQYSSL